MPCVATAKTRDDVVAIARDLLGYAGTPPDIIWPNGARVAVSVVVNFEEGAEQQVGDGDSRSERIGEVVSVVAPGTRDIGQEQIFGYGMRAGLWRFLDELQRSATPATFFCCGQAAQRVRSNLSEVARRGHEIACHGWRWRPHADYAGRDEERADLERCISAINAATGQVPLGFFCRGSESLATRELLAELGFIYTSNGFDDDLPYWDDSGLLVVPYALDSNDMKFFHPNGFVTAQHMIDYVNDGLDVLLQEAERGRSSLFNIGFHLRICGRPARFRAVSEILYRLAALGDSVWRARRIDIARQFAAQHVGNRALHHNL